jgi:hypothetical protein
MGNLLKVDNATTKARSTFRSYLRVLMEIDMHAPLNPGFLFHRGNSEPTWISLKYERLDIYCTKCGCIGHKKINCRAPQEKCFPRKYDISLQVNIFSNLPPSAASAKGSRESSSSLSQPTLAQNRPKEVVQYQHHSHPPQSCHYINHLTPTILTPLKHLPLQPNTPLTLTQALVDTSKQPITSFNENIDFSPTTSPKSDTEVLIETPKPSIPLPQLLPKACSSFISNPYNSNTSSISIILNQDQVRPSAIPQALPLPLLQAQHPS